MGVSKRKIIEANQEYYFETYAKAVTRAHWKMSFIIFLLLLGLVVSDVLAFLRLSFIQRAAQEFLEMDVEEWVNRQFFEARFILPVTVAVVIAVAPFVLWHYWKGVKSYELYKRKRRYIWIVAGVAAAEIAAACIVTGVISQSGWTAVIEGVTLLAALVPMLGGARIFIPWEVTPLPREGVEKAAEVVNTLLDWFSKFYLDKE